MTQMSKKKRMNPAAHSTISLKRKMSLSAMMAQGLRVMYNASHLLIYRDVVGSRGIMDWVEVGLI